MSNYINVRKPSYHQKCSHSVKNRLHGDVERICQDSTYHYLCVAHNYKYNLMLSVQIRNIQFLYRGKIILINVTEYRKYIFNKMFNNNYSLKNEEKKIDSKCFSDCLIVPNLSEIIYLIYLVIIILRIINP